MQPDLSQLPEKPGSTPAWLEDAIFYQIYPQSFCDSNGDGIGDIPGIAQKLGYLQSLGVNAIWINPCFESPFLDAGYDVSDYYKVAPRYGTNEDLRDLFEEARKHGIRVLLDLVPGHTSIDHPWFQQSSQHERNPYSDRYIWTDSAWKWDVPGYRLISGMAERDGTFMVNFFYAQPALNYGFAATDPTHPWQQPVDAPGPQAMRQELKQIMRFWLEMGASGFRVDMAGSLVKADPDHREIKKLWQEMRTWLDGEFPDAILIAEWSNPTVAIQSGFHMDFLLPFGTPGWTALLRKPYGPGPAYDRYAASFFDRSGRGNIQEFLDDYLKHYLATRNKGIIAIPTGNHDVTPRLSIGRNDADLKLIYDLLMTMPGVPFIYYGDEIGMRTVKGLPSKEGGYDRTGIRTPMQWDASVNAGFSTAPASQIYLPVDPDPQRPTAAAQAADPQSLLNHIRHLAQLRKSHPALQASSEFEVLYAQPGRCPFVFLRASDREHLLVAINPSDQPVHVFLPQLQAESVALLSGQQAAFIKESQGWALNLGPVSSGVFTIK
jgi:glycosidase